MEARTGDIFIVGNDDGVVLGRLPSDALHGDPEESIEQVMESGPATFRPSVPLEEMADYMREHGMDSALITTAEGRLVGILYLEDIRAGSWPMPVAGAERRKIAGKRTPTNPGRGRLHRGV